MVVRRPGFAARALPSEAVIVAGKSTAALACCPINVPARFCVTTDMFARYSLYTLAAALLLAPGTAGAQSADSIALSLEEAIRRAARLGDETQLASAQIEIADAQLTTARAAGLPQLRLQGSYQHVWANARGQAIGQLFNQPNTYNANANFSQSIFQGGRVIAGWRAANRLRKAARLSLQEASSQASIDAQRAYFAAIFAGRMVAIQTSNYQLASDRVSQVEKFQLAGRAARYDVLRARVERSNLEPLLVQARSDYDLAMLELKRITNIPPEREVVLTTSLDAASVQPLLVALEEDASAVANRPSVLAAEMFARARRDAIAVARADLLPTVSIFFQTGYQAFPQKGLPPGMGELVTTGCRPGASICNNGGWFPDRLLGINVAWPIFDGLRTKGNIDLAQAQARIAAIQLSQEREAVALEVAQARADLERARSQFAARQLSVSEANEAFSLASLRFSRGLDTQIEVSDAQLALLTAQTNEARAVFDLVIASTGLARALGRPLPFSPPPRTTPRATTSVLNATSPR